MNEPKPYACPKCNGRGLLTYDPKSPFFMMAGIGLWKCDVCDNGVLWSRTNETEPATGDNHG